jgi:hypothetical protein
MTTEHKLREALRIALEDFDSMESLGPTTEAVIDAAQKWYLATTTQPPAPEQQAPQWFPTRIMDLLRSVADRKGTDTVGPWQDGNGEPLQDDADAAIAWIQSAPPAAPEAVKPETERAELPPFPEPVYHRVEVSDTAYHGKRTTPLYGGEQMHAYARAALLSADSKAGGELCQRCVPVCRGGNGCFAGMPEATKVAMVGFNTRPQQQAKPLTVFDGFLCRAWGESELPVAELVSDWDGVRRFMVREWLGSEDATNYSGGNSLDQLKADFEEHEEDQRGGPLSYEFEIGGVSVERVCAHGIGDQA